MGARPADLPGQRLPDAGRRATSPPTRPTRPTWLWSGRTCGQRDFTRSRRPVHGQDELRRDRQPVIQRWSRRGLLRRALALAGDQFMPWGAYDPSGPSADRHFDRSVDPAEPQVRLLARHRVSGSWNAAFPGLTTALPTRPRRWLVRPHPEPRVPVRDRFPRRLQQHRRYRGRWRSRLLDRHAQRCDLRRPYRARRGRLLRESQLIGDLQPGGQAGGGGHTPPPAALARTLVACRSAPDLLYAAAQRAPAPTWSRKIGRLLGGARQRCGGALRDQRDHG